MKFKNSTCLGALTLMASIAPVATAEDKQDTIIVTSPGPSRTADELIGNATFMNREAIVDQLAGTLGDTLDRQPGVATTYFGAGASRPVLRGLGSERVLVLNNGIGTVDVSAASPDHQVMADGLDAERIEILRGPAALAYGGQAIGGVVNVIDGLILEKKPEKQTSAEVYGAYNSGNNGKELSARGQFVVGDFVFTLVGTKRDFDDFDIPGYSESARLHALEEQHEEGEDEHEGHEDEHNDEISGTVENSFLETDSISAGVSWIGKSGFIGFGIRHHTSLYGLPGHAHEEEHEDEHDEEHEHDEELPFIDMEQTRYDLRGGWTFENNVFSDAIATLSYADYSHIEYEAPAVAGTSFTSDGIEGRVELGHSWRGLKGAFGVHFIDKALASIGEEAFITPTEQNVTGLFVYETKEWEGGFGIEGGLRIDDVELKNQTMGDADFNLTSGSFGLHQHWANGWFIGSQVSYTQRAPNESELFAFGPHLATGQYEVGDSSLSKEKGLNFEASARWQNERLELGASIFHTDFKDFIYLAPSSIELDGSLQDEIDELAVYRFTQQDAKFSGGEIYSNFRVENGLVGADWDLEASLDYVIAELNNGSNVPYLPPLTFNAGSTARWGSLALVAELTVADVQNDAGEGQLPTDGYTLVNVKSSYDLPVFTSEGKRAQVFFNINNIGDEEIRYATSVLKDTVPAMGRNIRVGFRVSM